MTDLLAKGAAWLAAQRRKHFATTVSYMRPSYGSALNVPATIGRTVFEITDSSGMQTQVESRDFIIAESDLMLDGVPTEPASGDQIEDAAGIVYEVMAFGTEPAWRWVDGHRIDRRIHTKQVDTRVT